MGVVSDFLTRDLGRRLAEQWVLVWYDQEREWVSFVEGLLGSQLPEAAIAAEVDVAGVTASLVPFAGSFYEAALACERLEAGRDDTRILLYVPGEKPPEDLSPLRELECLGGDKEQLEIRLSAVARSALQAAGLPEGKIAELLSNESLGLRDLDAVVGSGETVSPLKAVFGSEREEDVVPLFLAREDLREATERKGLLSSLKELVAQGLGLDLRSADGVEPLRQELARALLVSEMRSDLEGDAPIEVGQIPSPPRPEQVERVRTICGRLRREHPDAYERTADDVQDQLGLAQADIDPGILGRIDTFRFEERRMLEACDGWLAAGEAQRVIDTVGARLRGGSFWTSLSRSPQRYAAWEACEALGQLDHAADRVEKGLDAPPKEASEWVDAYAREGGWHDLDQLFRRSRSLLSTIEEPDVLDAGARRVFDRYHAVIERMASGFTTALKASSWEAPGVLAQTQIFDRHAKKGAGRMAYLLADAMRFEMGAELAGRLRSAGCEAMRIEPALAAVPTITDVGMVALLPGAERSFSITDAGERGVSGAIGGKALVGAAARMDFAKGAVPGLVETTMGHVLEHGVTVERLAKEIGDAPLVIVRSTEIDGAGESLDPHAAEALMGSLLTSFVRAIQMLAKAGIERFAVAADHGHLFGDRQGDDMKIDPPQGGTKIDLHRRCWIGRGGSTPPACVRIAARDLGYQGTDLEIVMPRGTGVFKAGGSLAYHHGGVSLQELVIPVVTFTLKRKKVQGKKGDAQIALAKVPKTISNRIFSLTLDPRGQLALVDPLRLRVIAVSTVDGSTVGEVIGASSGWDAEARTISVSTNSIDLGLQLQDDEVPELRIVVIEVGTDRTLTDTEPIPVKVIQ